MMIKRYDSGVTSEHVHGIKEIEDGDYVLHSDHQSEVAKYKELLRECDNFIETIPSPMCDGAPRCALSYFYWNGQKLLTKIKEAL